MTTLRRSSLLLLSLLAVSACATRPPADEPEAVAEYEQNNDPLEPFNRAMYAVHDGIDTVLLRPAAKVYTTVIPSPVRTGVGNVLSNLRSPVVALNDLLQGNPDRLLVTVGRFMINTSFGLGGIFDVAGDTGMPGHNEDFGQTLATWGVGEGPYLFIPVLGPSNPRDLIGRGVDTVADPLLWIIANNGNTAENLGYVRLGLTILDTRAGLLDTVDQVRETSLDPYATFRSGYRQSRNQQIRNAGELPSRAGPLAPRDQAPMPMAAPADAGTPAAPPR